MLRRTFIIVIMGAVGGFAVDTDVARGVAGAAGIRIAAAFSLNKALTAGLTLTTGAFAPHHNVSLGAQIFLVIYAVFHSTL